MNEAIASGLLQREDIATEMMHRRGAAPGRESHPALQEVNTSSTLPCRRLSSAPTEDGLQGALLEAIFKDLPTAPSPRTVLPPLQLSPKACCTHPADRVGHCGMLPPMLLSPLAAATALPANLPSGTCQEEACRFLF